MISSEATIPDAMYNSGKKKRQQECTQQQKYIYKMFEK